MNDKSVYAKLKRTFHEPNRLAIVSALCASENGLTFNALKSECELTFGNLSSHLKTLQEANIIAVKKTFEQNKPLTTIFLTKSGRDQFIAYLTALEEVLTSATEALKTQKKLNLKPKTA